MDNNSSYNGTRQWDNLIPSKKAKTQPAKPAKRPSGNGKEPRWKVILRAIGDFPHDHPILFNIFLIIVAGLVILWFLASCMTVWTQHGEEVRVPDVKELPIDMATENLNRNGFSYEVIDSVYDAKVRPGSVVSQIPTGGSTVKPGRTVYLTIVATTPKTVAVPDFMNTSLRQAQASFEGLGVKRIKIEYVPSDYKDLVLGASADGQELYRGQRIPTSSTVTLKVGTGRISEEPEYDDSDFIVETGDDEIPTISLLDE